MLPSPTDIQYFLEVANTKNISRAAERLGIRQPSLSLSIQRLEQSVGAPLLIRSKTGVELTQAAYRLVQKSRNLLQEWDQIKGEVLFSREEIAGRFKIGCHVSVALYSLPGFLPQLLKDHPKIEVSLSHDLSRKITEDVISFKVDFGIVVNPVAHPDLVIKEIAKDEVSLWTARHNPNPDVLICDEELSQTQAILRQLKKNSIEIKRIVTTPSLEVVTSLTANGAGIGIIPSRVAQKDPALGLKLFAKDAPKYLDRVCLIFRAEAQKSRASKEIVKLISTKFSPQSEFL